MDTNHCDRCGAAGKTRFLMIGGNDLIFCGHHARKYSLGLLAAGFQADTVEVSDHPALVTA